MKDLLSRLNAADLRVAGSLLVLVIGYAAYWGSSRSLKSWARRGHCQPVMEQRLRTLLRLMALSVTLLMAVQQAGAFDHAWALLSAMATTVAIGFFAIWSVLSNMVCAFLILLFRPFRVGDWVEVVEGPPPHPGGWLVDMNLLFVSLADRPLSELSSQAEATYLRIPNTLFFQKVMRVRQAHVAAADKAFFS
jgi:small-conductance mechanosensitive channel